MNLLKWLIFFVFKYIYKYTLSAKGYKEIVYVNCYTDGEKESDQLQRSADDITQQFLQYKVEYEQSVAYYSATEHKSHIASPYRLVCHQLLEKEQYDHSAQGEGLYRAF
jgi:hypothetical protein